MRDAQEEARKVTHEIHREKRIDLGISDPEVGQGRATLQRSICKLAEDIYAAQAHFSCRTLITTVVISVLHKKCACWMNPDHIKLPRRRRLAPHRQQRGGLLEGTWWLV